jgi:hypothetical protein
MEDGPHSGKELGLRFGPGLESMKRSLALLERAPLSHELLMLDVSVIAAPLFEIAAWSYAQTKGRA